MLRRISQFFQAVGASLSYEDCQYVARHLSQKGQALFYGMHLADQTHALRTAYTAEALAEEEARYEPVNRKLLIRAALLHDAGRRKGDMDLWGKVFAVLMAGFFPQESRNMAKAGTGGFLEWPGHVLYVYYNHPKIGAQLLRSIGMRAEADLVERHHAPPQPGEAIELSILRRADERN